MSSITYVFIKFFVTFKALEKYPETSKYVSELLKLGLGNHDSAIIKFLDDIEMHIEELDQSVLDDKYLKSINVLRLLLNKLKKFSANAELNKHIENSIKKQPFDTNADFDKYCQYLTKFIDSLNLDETKITELQKIGVIAPSLPHEVAMYMFKFFDKRLLGKMQCVNHTANILAKVNELQAQNSLINFKLESVKISEFCFSGMVNDRNLLFMSLSKGRFLDIHYQIEDRINLYTVQVRNKSERLSIKFLKHKLSEILECIILPSGNIAILVFSDDANKFLLSIDIYLLNASNRLELLLNYKFTQDGLRSDISMSNNNTRLGFALLNETTLIYAKNGNQIVLYDLVAKTEKTKFDLKLEASITDIAWLDDDRFVTFSGNGELCVWSNSEKLEMIRGPEKLVTELQAYRRQRIAPLDEGHLLIWAGNNRAVILNIRTMDIVQELNNTNNIINFMRNGMFAVNSGLGLLGSSEVKIYQYPYLVPSLLEQPSHGQQTLQLKH